MRDFADVQTQLLFFEFEPDHVDHDFLAEFEAPEEDVQFLFPLLDVLAPVSVVPAVHKRNYRFMTYVSPPIHVRNSRTNEF